ncbi:hypothetical protein F5Y16DRAFT_88566 [Xylariaceae sp. FL0255]|nr:hypothetical protein F5Y16DRAFT_88566 [Xylariaceae sp. FL0255]
MLGLIGGNQRGGPSNMTVIDAAGTQTQIVSFATDLDGQSPKYRAPAPLIARHRNKLDNLDPELRNLVVLCAAQDVGKRPTIEYLLGEVETRATSRTQDYYIGMNYYANESDDKVREIVEEFMLNA